MAQRTPLQSCGSSGSRVPGPGGAWLHQGLAEAERASGTPGPTFHRAVSLHPCSSSPRLWLCGAQRLAERVASMNGSKKNIGGKERKSFSFNGQEINVYRFMPADGHRLLNRPNLRVSCSDACCFPQDALPRRAQAGGDPRRCGQRAGPGAAADGGTSSKQRSREGTRGAAASRNGSAGLCRNSLGAGSRQPGSLFLSDQQIVNFRRQITFYSHFKKNLFYFLAS